MQHLESKCSSQPNNNPWLPRGFSFLSGLPEAKRRRRQLLILQAYIDESGSRNQDACMVLAGFLAPAENWASFSDEWQRCLDMQPRIDFFKMSHAMNSPSGQFWGWDRDAVRSRVRELVRIIGKYATQAIHCTTWFQDFGETLAKEKGTMANVYSLNFHAVLAGVGYEGIESGVERVELIFDEQDKYSRLIKNTYPFFRRKVEPELRDILPLEPMFRKDTELLPLQAADMLAWLLRNCWNGKRTEYDWIAEELMPLIPMSRYSSFYTKERLEGVMRLTDEISLTSEDMTELRRIYLLTRASKGRKGKAQ